MHLHSSHSDCEVVLQAVSSFSWNAQESLRTSASKEQRERSGLPETAVISLTVPATNRDCAELLDPVPSSCLPSQRLLQPRTFTLLNSDYCVLFYIFAFAECFYPAIYFPVSVPIYFISLHYLIYMFAFLFFSKWDRGSMGRTLRISGVTKRKEVEACSPTHHLLQSLPTN